MPRSPDRPPQLRGRVFRGRTAITAGLLTPDQLRTRAWRRLFQGVYADSSLTITHRFRCLVAAEFLLPPTGVIAGRSAAAIHGVGLGDPDDDVEALVPLGTEIVPHIGVVVHQGTLAAEEWWRISGLAVTGPVRTCWDLARWLPPAEAAVFIDRMIGGGVVAQAELVAYLKLRLNEVPAPRGVRHFARIVPLVDGWAGSPQESRLRVRFVLAGLPPPQPQFTIFDAAGRFIARVDLAWAEFKIAVEYDGLWHVGSASQMHDDRKRLNALVSEGWTVLHVTSARLNTDFDALVREVRAALRRRPR